MSVRKMTCIECPMGCELEVEFDGENVISVKGNSCPRGKIYAENEVVCPRRVITSTVRSQEGVMVPVKTEKPVKKTEMFEIMKKINEATCTLPVKIGDVIVANISEDIHLIASGNVEKR